MAKTGSLGSTGSHRRPARPRRLWLVRHASTAATRAAAFALDEPLDAGGRAAAAGLAAALPHRPEALCSPALRCRETAELAGLDARIDPALAECDFGAWGGRTLVEVSAVEPDAVAAWITDPDARPHEGETLTELAARVASWLDAQAKQEGDAVAVTHAGVVKAAVVHALGAPLEAFWRIDVAPLAVTELHAHDRRWTLTRANVELPRTAREQAAVA